MSLRRSDLRRQITRVRKLIALKSLPFSNTTDRAKRERLAKSEADPRYFFKTYLPHYFTLEFADFHREIMEFCEIEDEPVFIAAPREHAKSTIVSFGMPLRAILLARKHFILMISDTVDLASSYLMFIKLELEENERIKQDFGNLIGYPWTDDDFTTRSGIRVKARGAMGRVRGLKNRQFRPDYVILDDFENDKTVKNQKLVKERINWLKEAVIPSLTDEYYFNYVGTIISKKCVLNQFITSEEPRYISKIYRAITDGVCLWPARWDKAKLDRRKRVIGSMAFNKEYQNDPKDDEGLFREEWIKWTPVAPSGLRIYGYLDPSMKHGQTNDYKAFISIGIDTAGIIYVLASDLMRESINGMTEKIYDRYEQFKHLVIGAEENALGDFLYVPFDEAAKERGYVLPLKGINHSTDKTARVSKLSPLVERGKIIFVKNKGNETLVMQLIYFPNYENDDGPDALEGAVSIAEKYRAPMGYRTVTQGRSFLYGAF